MYTHARLSFFLKKKMTETESLWDQFDIFRQTELKGKEKIVEETDIYRCKCGGTKVFNRDGMPTCTSCGVVGYIHVTDTAEWASGLDDSGKVTDHSRCGAPQDLELFSSQWGSATMLFKQGKQSYSQKRLAKINFHLSMNHRDRALFHAYKDIDEAAKTVLNIPDAVARHAKILYRYFNSSKLTRGAVRTGIKANCLLYACKNGNIPRTTKEIADAYGIPTKDVSRTADMFRDIIMAADMSTMALTVPQTVKTTRPADIIPRLISLFDIGLNKRAYTIKCNKICEKLENCIELMGKTPNSIASVVIMTVLELSKQEVCKVCKISMPTINKIEIIVKKHLED